MAQEIAYSANGHPVEQGFDPAGYETGSVASKANASMRARKQGADLPQTTSPGFGQGLLDSVSQFAHPWETAKAAFAAGMPPPPGFNELRLLAQPALDVAHGQSSYRSSGQLAGTAGQMALAAGGGALAETPMGAGILGGARRAVGNSMGELGNIPILGTIGKALVKGFKGVGEGFNAANQAKQASRWTNYGDPIGPGMTPTEPFNPANFWGGEANPIPPDPTAAFQSPQHASYELTTPGQGIVEKPVLPPADFTPVPVPPESISAVPDAPGINPFTPTNGPIPSAVGGGSPAVNSQSVVQDAAQRAGLPDSWQGPQPPGFNAAAAEDYPQQPPFARGPAPMNASNPQSLVPGTFFSPGEMDQMLRWMQTVDENNNFLKEFRSNPGYLSLR